RTLPLSRNPFTHVGRTVFKFDSARLRKAKNLDRFVTHRVTSVRSIAIPFVVLSLSVNSRSVSTCVPSMRPLTRKTTKPSGARTRSILQVIAYPDSSSLQDSRLLFCAGHLLAIGWRDTRLRWKRKGATATRRAQAHRAQQLRARFLRMSTQQVAHSCVPV